MFKQYYKKKTFTHNVALEKEIVSERFCDLSKTPLKKNLKLSLSSLSIARRHSLLFIKSRHLPIGNTFSKESLNKIYVEYNIESE